MYYTEGFEAQAGEVATSIGLTPSGLFPPALPLADPTKIADANILVLLGADKAGGVTATPPVAADAVTGDTTTFSSAHHLSRPAAAARRDRRSGAQLRERGAPRPRSPRTCVRTPRPRPQRSTSDTTWRSCGSVTPSSTSPTIATTGRPACAAMVATPPTTLPSKLSSSSLRR